MKMDNIFECCTNFAGPDFSKMSFQNVDLSFLSHVNWHDPNLWQSALLIFLLPFCRSMMNCFEQQCTPFKKDNTWPKVFDVVSILLGLWKLILCWQTVMHQPVWRYLQTNLILFTSYIFIAVGVFFITTCVCRFGMWDTFFRRRFPSRGSPNRSSGSSPKKRAGSSPAPLPRKYQDLHVVFNFGCFWAFLGSCLMCASQAGLVLMAVQAITYCFCYKGV